MGSASAMTLFTLGYEGLDLAAFAALLARHGVETVVDVRQLPLSRKPGFSKQALRHELQQAGFGYTHIGALGCPRPVRDAYKHDRDWARYTEGFMRHLGQQQSAIGELAALARTTRCALLCLEADFILRCFEYGSSRVVVVQDRAQAPDLETIDAGLMIGGPRIRRCRLRNESGDDGPGR